jgi:hypothetical integral membrane protein (TIGR02206 family)
MTEEFRPFTLTHAIVLAAIAALIWLLVSYARRVHPNTRLHLERGLATINALLWLVVQGWWMLPPRFDPATSLPLHMCHLVSLLASAALLVPARWLRTLLYFWGIGLCSQALITPSLREPPSSVWFWAFWIEHGLLIAIAVYDLVVREYRPTWRDYGFACAAAVAYLAVVLPLDIALQTDYGFVGVPKPENPSVLDLLGPWPERLGSIVMLVAAAMAALMLPWRMTKAASQRS